MWWHRSFALLSRSQENPLAKQRLQHQHASCFSPSNCTPLSITSSQPMTCRMNKHTRYFRLGDGRSPPQPNCSSRANSFGQARTQHARVNSWMQLSWARAAAIVMPLPLAAACPKCMTVISDLDVSGVFHASPNLMTLDGWMEPQGETNLSVILVGIIVHLFGIVSFLNHWRRMEPPTFA